MSKRKRPFDEEFDLLKQIQVDRMAHRESLVCHERCVKHYWFNGFYFNEKKCMQNCFELLNQVTVITNIAQSEFDRHAAKGKK